MDSITKTKLSNEQIKQVCNADFGKNLEILSIEELSDGYFNTTYLVTFKDQFKTILKVAPNKNVKLMRYEKNIMDAEVYVLNAVKANTSVPVPKVYSYNNKMDIIQNEYFFMEYISGVSLYTVKADLTPESHEKIYTQLGSYTREINNISNDGFGYISREDSKYKTWFEAFYKLMDDVLLDGIDADVKLPINYDEIYALVSSKKAILNKIVRPSLLHKDMWSGNIFVDVNTSNITGIIDCERAIWGDPLMEFVFGFSEENVSFNKGYNRTKVIVAEDLCLKSLYHMYLNLILIIEQYYRLYPDNRLELKARKNILKDFEALTSL